MTKINFPTGEVWHEFELVTGLITPPKLKLKLKPSFKKDLIHSTLRQIDVSKESAAAGRMSKEEMLESFENSCAYAMKHVTAWDLEDGKGASIPCSDINKKKYLDPLLWETLKDEKKYESKAEEIKASRWLWSAIIEFIGEVKNFTKN